MDGQYTSYLLCYIFNYLLTIVYNYISLQYTMFMFEEALISMLNWVSKLGWVVRLGRLGWVAWQCKVGWVTRRPQVPTYSL